MRKTISPLSFILIAFIFGLSTKSLQAQQSVVDIAISLQKLNHLGSVMYFAAHPDDENTKLIAWLARERKFKTTYLSLTRGDGGQNLLGTDLGINLGIIRTQELLAARQVDKGEQLFSSAYDFGFSKTHEETFKFWDHETILREAVWLIRKYQPDVIITRFPPDPRGGHGHHQASAILAHEAFLAAADKNKFPEQLNKVSTWQAKRLVWNTANFGGQNNTSDDQLKIDIGHYNTLLGQSYGEVSAQSRSQHKTQGFGSASSRGTSFEYFDHVAGEKANTDLFDGINTSWSRIPNTSAIQQLVDKINKEFNFQNPQQSIADLVALKKLLEGYTLDKKYSQHANHGFWIAQKLKEVEELILACSGFWVDVYSAQASFVKGTKINATVEAIAYAKDIEVEIVSIDGKTIHQKLQSNKLWRDNIETSYAKTTQPYWLVQPHSLGRFDIPLEVVGHPTNPDKPQVKLIVKVENTNIHIVKDIHHRFVDPVKGEVHNPIVILPAMTAEVSSSLALSTNQQARQIDITFTRHDLQRSSFNVKVNQPEGWKVEPSTLELDFEASDKITKTITIAPTGKNSKKGVVTFSSNEEKLCYIKTLDYDHIPQQTWFPTTEIICQNLQLENTVRHVGYLAGAGDLVGESLKHIGIKVSNLTETDLNNPSSLTQYEAIIVGVRFFNVINNSSQLLDRLLEYANNGGVVVFQYNVNTKLLTNRLGPYPFQITRDRVTEEDSPVSFERQDKAFSFPNRITESDFEGWIQERGLYFARNIDKRYRTPLRMHDKGEAPHEGSLLICNYGKGKFVYTSLAFFRQLPAGVPGAYRLFVNLLANEN